jgi:hypothetical protein
MGYPMGALAPDDSLRQTSPFIFMDVHLADPHDSANFWWVTVFIPDYVSFGTHGDPDIMKLICKLLSEPDSLIEIGEKALHGRGNSCISFPIKKTGHGQTRDVIINQASILTDWWWKMIWGDNELFLDQQMIFRVTNGVVDEEMIEVPLDWNKPAFSCPPTPSPN